MYRNSGHPKPKVLSGMIFLLFITLINVSPASSSRFISDDSIGTILDSETGLVWLEGPSEETQWFEANDWFEDLETGWRVPCPEELEVLFGSGITFDTPEPFLLDGNFIWCEDLSQFDSVMCFDFISATTRRVADWRAYEYMGGFRAMAVRESIPE